jgi:hypothetical protein
MWPQDWRGMRGEDGRNFVCDESGYPAPAQRAAVQRAVAGLGRRWVARCEPKVDSRFPARMPDAGL